MVLLFLEISSAMSPTDLVTMLNNIVNGFDNLTDTYELEKIKTIGTFLIVCNSNVGHNGYCHP